MSSLLVTFLCSSWLVSLAVLVFVTTIQGFKLKKIDIITYTLLMSILHCIAFTSLPRPISSYVCMITFSMLLAYLLDFKIKNSIILVFIWSFITIIFEMPTTIFIEHVFSISTDFGKMNTYQFYVASLVFNSTMLIMTTMLARCFKMGMWVFGSTKGKINVNKPAEKK